MPDTQPLRHVHDVALMFEGGGMRASYTSAMAVTLLEHGIDFDFVCGLSAGASLSVNYVSRDIDRTRKSFTEIVKDPRFGDWRTFLQHKGFFSAKWLYQETCLPDSVLPFHMDAFLANPAQVAIQAFDRDSGETVVWTKDDMQTLQDLMIRVQASSTLPFVMPAVKIDGHTYYDGGYGIDGGLTYDLAFQAGYERVFAVLTRPRGYRKGAPSSMDKYLARFYWRHPKLAEAILARPAIYNAALDRLEELAAEGKAYIVYADKMAVSNGTTDYDALIRSYNDGYAQAQEELPQWLEWLGV